MNMPIPTLRRMQDAETSADMRTWAQACHAEHAPLGHYWGRVFGSVHVVARNEIHTNRDPAGRPGISLFLCPSTPAEGVDVSDYQCPTHPPRGIACKNRAPMDWAKVAAAGKSFAWIKATEGATGDGSATQHYLDNWTHAGEQGLLRAAYHFFRMTSSPEDQAKNFAFHAKPADPGMVHVLDVETLDDHAIGDVARAVVQFLDALPDVSFAFYTFPAFWGMAPDVGIERRCKLWIANFDVYAPKVPHRWNGWDWWQYASKGRCPGIPGNADLNRYRGSLAEMLAGGPVRVVDTLPDLATTLGVQMALNRITTSGPPLAEDGIMGPMTQAAIARFQRLAGLDVDGVVGPHTQAALAVALT